MISILINTDHYQLTAVVTVFGGVEHESHDQHNAFCGHHMSVHPPKTYHQRSNCTSHLHEDQLSQRHILHMGTNKFLSSLYIFMI